MESWRKVAIDLLPEKKDEILNDSLVFSPYSLFVSVKVFWEEAVRNGDKEFGERIIKLVEWFLDNKEDGDLYNALCTSFLEHIPDDDIGLYFAEEMFPEHVYLLAIECSAYLRRNQKGWQAFLEDSISRYNELHGLDISIN